LRVTDTGLASRRAICRTVPAFRRIDGARRRSHEGSGIGWHWCRSWWRCTAAPSAWKSKLGEGTTFTVRMPVGQHHLTHGRVVTEGQTPLGLRAPAVAYVQEAMGWLPGPRSAQERSNALAVHGDQN